MTLSPDPRWKYHLFQHHKEDDLSELLQILMVNVRAATGLFLCVSQVVLHLQAQHRSDHIPRDLLLPHMSCWWLSSFPGWSFRHPYENLG